MKYYILVSLLALFYLTAYSQKRMFNEARFRGELEQYITREAGLTPNEAARFFPLFNEMLDKQRYYFDKIRSARLFKPANEIECKKAIVDNDKMDIEIKRIQQSYHVKFMKVLSPSKLFEVIKAEERFHRRAFKRMMKK